jgi:hypothetical protein
MPDFVTLPGLLSFHTLVSSEAPVISVIFFPREKQSTFAPPDLAQIQPIGSQNTVMEQ